MVALSVKSTYKIKSNLYLGDVKLARSKFFLESNHIFGIVNATTSEPNAYPDLYDYLRVDVNDEPTEQISSYFQPVFNFIQRHHRLDHNVFVHCHMGISRSATLVIAFLMIDGPRTLREAFQEVKNVRPHIDPNEGFLRQLRDLEKNLFGEAKTLNRISDLDVSIDESSDIVIKRVLKVLETYVAGFAGDASPQTLDILEEKLRDLSAKVKYDDIPKLVSSSFDKCAQMIRYDDSIGQDVNIGFQQALVAICSPHQIDINDSILEPNIVGRTVFGSSI